MSQHKPGSFSYQAPQDIPSLFAEALQSLFLAACQSSQELGPHTGSSNAQETRYRANTCCETGAIRNE